MKKIIKNKRYDTETADFKGSWSNGLSDQDLEHCTEELYRKRTGEFFLYGRGGALTIYASRSGAYSGDGENIFPLTYEQARQWAEKKLSVDEYEDIFVNITEDDSIISVGFHFPVYTQEKLKKIALEQGKTMSKALINIIDQAYELL